MQNSTNYMDSTELSIILPLIGENIYFEGMLKLLTIDIATTYEIIFVCNLEEIDPSVVERLSKKYPAVIWLGKNQAESTLEALKHGLEIANGHYILVICADTAGPYIPVNEMLNMAKQGCDFVGSTRYSSNGRRLGGPILEITLSRLANHVLHMAGCAFTDATSGMKLFKKTIFPKLTLESNSTGWVIAFEMALKAQLAGLKLGEIANIAIDRLYGGKSTCQFNREFFDYIKWFCWGLIKLAGSKSQNQSTNAVV
jgi:dolichol-phosphate mannosyltransferase